MEEEGGAEASVNELVSSVREEAPVGVTSGRGQMVGIGEALHFGERVGNLVEAIEQGASLKVKVDDEEFEI